MLNTKMFAAEPFLTPVPWKRGLERLSLVPVDAEPTRSSETLTAAEAVVRLTAAGLTCAKASGQRLHILGGLSTFIVRGIEGYQSGFAILASPTGEYNVIVAGTRSTYDEEAQLDTLAQAVDTVLRVYRSRGEIPVVGQGVERFHA
jgi:hypothetical protein